MRFQNYTVFRRNPEVSPQNDSLEIIQLTGSWLGSVSLPVKEIKGRKKKSEMQQIFFFLTDSAVEGRRL